MVGGTSTRLALVVFQSVYFVMGRIAIDCLNWLWIYFLSACGCGFCWPRYELLNKSR